MVTELRIYFEGDPKLKPGFSEFLREIREAAWNRKCRFQPVATNGTPVQDFQIALDTHRAAWNVLLLDSDVPVNSSLADLCLSKKLNPSHEEFVFWMVQIMESWFLADIAAPESLLW